MDEENDGIDLEAYSPSWMLEGGVFSQTQESPFDQDDSDWDTNAWSRDTPDQGEVRGSGCSAPESGTYVWGAVDGVCQWINTTTC